MTWPTFHISSPDRAAIPKLKQVVDGKTKPVGSLGRLEDIAVKIGTVQQSAAPVLRKPHILIFAGDHGIAEEGVSAYPREVTHQMVLNFLKGGAAINVFARQHGIALTVVDAGVDHDLGALDHPAFRDRKIGYGTKNFLCRSAMSEGECIRALEAGGTLIDDIHREGTNIVGFGEMGIGNTSSASLMMAGMTDVPVAGCVGKGTGIDSAGLQRKIAILERAFINMKHPPFRGTPQEVLQYAGGFEMAMMCGAMLKAAEKKMVLLIDGFIATSVFLCAVKWHPGIADYAIFCHQSDERGHQRLLFECGDIPILSLNMRLGEGTGCAVAYPLVQSAVLFLNEMASFEDAGIEQGRI